MSSSSIILSGVLLFHGPLGALEPLTQSALREPSFANGLAYVDHGLESSPVSPGLLSGDPPSGLGNPPSRSSGGGRAPCSSLMVAMVPGVGTFLEGEDCVEASDGLLAYTGDHQPRFWLYIPGDHEAGTVLKVQLTQGRQLIEAKDFLLPTTPGLIAVQLDTALEPGRSYTWIAEVMVNTGRGRRGNPLVEGMVEYRPLGSEVEMQMGLLSPLDRVQQYREQEFWYDALGELADLRRSEPDNAEVLEAWRELLASYGLEIFADQPLLDCCQVAAP